MNDQTTPVRENGRFDEATLHARPRVNGERFSGPMDVRQFAGRHSCPAFRLVAPDAPWVLRFAAIVHGTKKRMLRGNASSGEAGVPGERLSGFARIGHAIAEGTV